MKANRMSLITLGVSNIAASRAYYEALGWTPEEALENVIFYDMGGMKFGLFPLEVLAVEQKRPVTELGLGATTIAQNYNSAAEVDAAFAAALAAGATALHSQMQWTGAVILLMSRIRMGTFGNLPLIRFGRSMKTAKSRDSLGL